MKERINLELKESITNTFIKTVSAYANYGTGEIMFGVKNNGEIVGIDNPEEACLNLENKINDLIKPKPTFSFSINHKTNVITLVVREGQFKPYLYKGKAYKRNDTSTVEVDQVELKRLVLIGENLYFDELPTNRSNLTFNYFFEVLKEKLFVSNPNEDTLKTIGLLNNDNKYNNAAILFCDQNDFPGIDIVRFGSNSNEIMRRENLFGNSILEQFDQAVEIFDSYYKLEEIKGMERRERYLVPKEAFREVIANALVHRTWDINSNIRVLMYLDKIEVSSPGGLPVGLSKEEYLNGRISNLRNPIVGNIFFRLNLIEMFATGIRRIKESYININHKPIFEVSQNSIVISLPTTTMKESMTVDERTIHELLSSGILFSSSDLAEKSGFSKNKVVRLLNSLQEKHYVRKEGAGRSTKYYLG